MNNQLFGQSSDNWILYSSYSSIKSLITSQDAFLATTGGGIIISDNDQLNTLNVSDGIYKNEATTIISDSVNALIYLGYPDGTIDVFNKLDNSIQRLDDIRRVERFDSKAVNSLVIHENSLYVATDFGLVVYDLQSLLVSDSYFKFNSFDYGIKVSDLIIKQDSIYVATTQGVALASLNNELSNINNWDTFNTSNGLNTNEIDKIITFNDSVYVLNDLNISVLRDGNFEETFIEIGLPVLDVSMSSDGEYLAILTKQSVHTYDQNLFATRIEVNDIGGKNTVGLLHEDVIIGTDYTGIYSIDMVNMERRHFLPDGPQFNYLNKLLYDNGVLVGTSSSAFPGFDPLNPFRGYSIYDGSNWENYNRLYNQELSFVETVYSVGQTTDSYFLGSWGDGVIKQTKSNNEIEVYNASNSNLSGINADNNFVVISGLSKDSDNNMWAISYLSEYPLNVLMNGDNEWQNFQNILGSDNYYNLFIDSNDQKWISLITNTNTGLGLLVLNTNEEITQTDDEFIKLTTNPDGGNLPHPRVNVIIEDRDGEIWIGTDRGIARFIFPQFVINGSANERQAQWLINEDTTAASRFLLRDLNVSALALNPANQKWVGSKNQGLWLLNDEGSRILKRLTTQNSNLISNNINDIKVNKVTGEVFISTDLGLVSYQDVPKAASAEMNALKVYPNPFRYTEHDQILIEGLTEETTVKILGIDGFVVNELETRGGRVSWDGRDYNGNELGTGVYYVVANSTSGNGKGIGKVVIIN